MSDNELAYLPVTELVALIRTKQLSPVELLDDVLDRVERRNPSLNAVVYLNVEEARRRAKRAEDDVGDGTELGPLHGIPTLLKDGFGLKTGWVSTYGGVEPLRRLRDPSYCAFAERVENAGAVIIGKTNAPAMGFRGTCDNFLFGPTRNPFDLTRNSGGSSGGSAAAVADGLVAFAEGTDGGGSIRIPAAWCGLVGFKPSWGRVPLFRRPDIFNISTFTAEGPLTRTVADAALVLDAICGYDPRDPFSLDQKTGFVDALDADVRGWRVGFNADFGVYPVDPEIVEVAKAAAGAFEECGATVEEAAVHIPFDQQELSDLWCRMMALLGIDLISSLRVRGVDILTEGADFLPSEYTRWIDVVAHMTCADLSRDNVMRTAIFDAIQSSLATYDLLVTPTLACLPVKNDSSGNTLGPTSIGGVPINPLIGWCMTYLVNFTGHPAVSVPAGLSTTGLPVGLQIIGRRYADASVVTASAALERARPWRQIYQRCAERRLDT